MRMYNLENKSILALKKLRDLVLVSSELTVEEKEANLKEIDNKLTYKIPIDCLVESSVVEAGEIE